MKSSKTTDILLLFSFLLACGCQSSKNFQMTTLEKEELSIIEVDSRRIIQECYFLNAQKENNWRHQYILYILNEKNEAIPVFYPTNQGKPECMSHLKKVEKILNKSSRVKLCVRDQLEKMNESSKTETHDFGPLGIHQSPYYALTFDTICNSRECHSISKTWTYTCPNLN